MKRGDLHGQVLDDANNATMLAALHGIPDRRARYVCVAAFVDGGRELLRRGETSGRMTMEARGMGGFGYDPYFLSDELGITFGEADRVEKERISHRGRAFRALVAALEPVGHR
jgi:XTP/dITP diphosphohydrolase